jgi:hypothetical protein
MWLFIWYKFPKFYPRLHSFLSFIVKHDTTISRIFTVTFYVLFISTFLWEALINERTFRYSILVFIVFSTISFVLSLCLFLHNLLFFVCPEASEFSWSKNPNMRMIHEYVSENHHDQYVKFYTLLWNDGKPIIWPTKPGEEFKFRQ